MRYRVEFGSGVAGRIRRPALVDIRSVLPFSSAVWGRFDHDGFRSGFQTPVEILIDI